MAPLPGGISPQTGVIIQPQQILFTGNKTQVIAYNSGSTYTSTSADNCHWPAAATGPACSTASSAGVASWWNWGYVSSEEDEDEEEDYDDDEEEDKEKDGAEDGQVEEVSFSKDLKWGPAQLFSFTWCQFDEFCVFRGC